MIKLFYIHLLGIMHEFFGVITEAESFFLFCFKDRWMYETICILTDSFEITRSIPSSRVSIRRL